MKIRSAIAATALFIAAFVAGPKADATPADQVATKICGYLAENPTDEGIEAVGKTLIDNGLTAEEAATVVVYSVAEYCPDTWYVIQHYTDGAPVGSAA